MTVSHFKTNANVASCPTGQPNQQQADITNRKGGYLNPPDGLFSAAWIESGITIRWAVGEPVWCAGQNEIRIPFRYFSFSDGKNWTTTGFDLSQQAGERLSLTCLGSTGIQNTWLSNTASVIKTGPSGSGQYGGSTYSVSNARQANASFRLSSATGQVNGAGSTNVQGINFLNTAGSSGCTTILNITMTVATDTIGGAKTVQWSAARAVNGQPNTWSLDDIVELNCNVQNPPIECIGQPTTPYLTACGKLDLLAIDWTALVECVVGTPDDYIAGISFLDEELDMPLPGTGPCSPWTLGTIFNVPFTLDLCGWYPAARPTIDLLMTASLWIAVIASVFRTRAGTNE